MAFGIGKKNSPENDIKKLSRAELLEMLIEQTQLADRLRQRNKKLTKELAVCKANLEKAASLQIIMRRLERIEKLSAAHAGLTEEEIAEIWSMGRKKKAAPVKPEAAQEEAATEEAAAEENPEMVQGEPAAGEEREAVTEIEEPETESEEPEEAEPGKVEDY